MDKVLSENDLQDKIVDGIIENDEQALSDIIKYYFEPLKAFVKGYYGDLFNEHEIEDIVIVAIRKFWDARNSYNDSKAKIKTYICAIATNVGKDILKSNWHKAKQQQESSEQDFLDNSLATFFHMNQQVIEYDEKEQSDICKAAKEVFESLPDKEREVLLIDSITEDETSKEIGKRLDIPDSSVRVYRKRGKEKFQKKMHEKGFNDLEIKK